MYKLIASMLVVLSTTAARADDPIIEHVMTSRDGDLWTFDVTVSHGDTGWDHYADAWRILDENGRELGQRDLAHPHIEEQPFTRSLSGVAVPSEVSGVTIQVHDSVTGWAANARRITLK